MAEDNVDFAKVVRMAREFSRPYRVANGSKFKLPDVDPGDTAHLNREDKPAAQEALAVGRNALSELQDKLYAQDRWSVLLVFQAMDAAGKDGVIKHVMSGVNPQGCQVTSFKAPTTEELDHDYMWRCAKNLPERGRIGIFNRSYYEEVLVVKVHPEYLEAQKLPPSLVGKHVWDERYEDIRAMEGHLARNGTAIRRFFHHVSDGAAKRRFLERLNTPAKPWPFDLADLRTRARWEDYMRTYEVAIHETAADAEPGADVSADEKWFTRLVVAAVVVHALQRRGAHGATDGWTRTGT